MQTEYVFIKPNGKRATLRPRERRAVVGIREVELERRTLGWSHEDVLVVTLDVEFSTKEKRHAQDSNDDVRRG